MKRKLLRCKLEGLKVIDPIKQNYEIYFGGGGEEKRWRRSSGPFWTCPV